MIKKIIFALLIIAAVSVLIWYFKPPYSSAPSEETARPIDNALLQQPMVIDNSVSATYRSGSTTVDAVFKDDLVTFTHPELGAFILPRVISGSGARYANKDESIVFWNKGDEATIYKNKVIVFLGTKDR